MGTLYERLQVPLTADTGAIRAAYRKLARQWHPDRHRGDDGGLAQRRFQEIQEAYEVLMDAPRRRAYDMQLLHLLDVEEYLSRFHELVLTVNGLDMAPPPRPAPGPCAALPCGRGGRGLRGAGRPRAEPHGCGRMLKAA
ncbi:MAG: DnaJ domain-containing protein [Monoraphidium minutum]|nr:MAG: DnaJ domain-containing protein [Monoraphidium minutum]